MADTMFVFPCRVFAETYEQAQELVAAKIVSRGFDPTEVPKPFPCPVQCWSGGTWWECFCRCEVKKV